MDKFQPGEIRNGFPVLPQEERKTILLMSDDLRFPSGVGTVAREIVLGTCHYFNWIQIGGAAKHPEANKTVSLDKLITKETGVLDPSVIIYGVNGYGNPQLVRMIIARHSPSAIFHFTDPRFWEWLYRMNGELKVQIPLIYYDLWDDLPSPNYNTAFYQSCDLLININRQTHLMVESLLEKENTCDLYYKKKKQDLSKILLDYVPHGINPKSYFPLHPNDDQVIKYKQKIFGNKELDFVVFYNNRNVRRKQTSDVILAYRHFYLSLDKEKAEKCALLLHTVGRDENGTDLFRVINDLALNMNIYIDEDKIDLKQMNLLYNIADVTINIASNEGFGLSSAESIMAGTMILNNVTGGLQDQLRFEDEKGNWIRFTEEFPTNHNGRYKKCGIWGIPIFPKTRSLQGSIPTPYIFDDRCDWEEAGNKLIEIYNIPAKERRERALKGREWMLSEESRMSSSEMSKLIVQDINILLENWKPKKPFELIDTNNPLKIKTVGILKSEL